MKTIESTQNALIKKRAKLKSKKFRDETGLALIEGEHLVQEAIKHSILKELFIINGDIPFDTDVEIYLCTPEILKKLSSQKSEPKMIGVIEIPQAKTEQLEKVVLLDRIQDPGNFGTIIRSSIAFGIDAIIYNEGTADPYSPKVIQASQGAVFEIPLIKADLTSFMDENKLTYYATALHQDSVPLSLLKPEKHFGLLMGNEGQGLNADLLDKADTTVEIEMDAFESLNVGVACSICLYDFFIKTRD